MSDDLEIAHYGLLFREIGADECEYHNHSVPKGGVLTVTLDAREVEHDGYCSDPGEDTGEWRYDKEVVWHLDQRRYDTLSKYARADGEMDLAVLQKLVGERRGCTMGSGYCGGTSEYIVKRGVLTKFQAAPAANSTSVREQSE